MKKVSVISSIYNVGEFVENFAVSLFSQTYNNIEFILINDGSTDNSIEIVKKVLDSDFSHLKERVKIFNNENQGLPKSRAFGLKHATGDYFLLVDSDDWMEKDMVERMVKCAEETAADMVYCNFFFEYPDKKVEFREQDFDETGKQEWMERIFQWISYSYLWFCFFDMRLYRDIDLVVPVRQMNEDTLFFYQFLEKAQKIVHLNEPLYHYRQRPESMSNDKSRRKRNRAGSARNFLEMARIHQQINGQAMSRDTVRKAIVHSGWSALKFDRSIYRDYPELAGYLREIPVSTKWYDPVPKQILMKIYVWGKAAADFFKNASKCRK